MFDVVRESDKGFSEGAMWRL